MKIAKKALILMASLATRGVGSAVLNRCTASAFAWNSSPSAAAKKAQHIMHKSSSLALTQSCAHATSSSSSPMQHCQSPWMNKSKQQQLFQPQCNMQMKLGSRSITHLFMSSSNDENENDSSTTEERTSFNIPVLKKETARLTLRTHKKIGKASTRIRYAEEQYEKLRVAIDTNTDADMDDKLLQQLEEAPNIQQFKNDLQQLQNRLQKLNWLEEQFSKPPLKSKKQLSSHDLLSSELYGEEGRQVLEYILELEISDDELSKQKRIEQNAQNRRSKKERAIQRKEEGGGGGEGNGPRLPYRRYYTETNVEIRVGKQATDNDVLSLSPEHRSGSHWWYHASGCPGSHVVLCTDASKPNEEDVLDAASLAALKSKCIGQSVIKVSMTRARNVSKPPGAKAGLVQLNGDVKTITVRKGEVEKRCKRLEETVVVN